MLKAVILAGGQATRMGGVDKGAVELNGRRLIDHVVRQIWPQCHQIYIAGPTDYGLGVPTLGDDDAFEGPVAGLFGAQKAFQGDVATLGFICVPVDGPQFPKDLSQSLSAQPRGSAIARDDVGVHPTFAYWSLKNLSQARASLAPGASLRAVAKHAQAHEEVWPGAHYFRNINAPSDLTSI